MTNLPTRLHAVALFPDRARLTRQGHLPLEPGTHRLEIPDLPLSLDPDSVRAQARGPARARLLGVDVRKTFYAHTPPGAARDLQDEIQRLEDQDRTLADEGESSTAQIAHLDGLSSATQTFASGLARGKTTLENQAAFLEFFANRRTAAQARLREIAIQRRKIAEEIAKLRKQLQQIREARPKERYTASIDVEVTQAGELEFQLSYMQTGASWKPVYDVYLRGDRLEIHYYGQVSQTTGEDWEGVALALSTARPTRATLVPELKPWYIAPHFPPPPSPMRAMATPAAGQALLAKPAAADEPIAVLSAPMPQAEAEIATADVQQQGASVTYQVGHGIDVPGDGGPHKITIGVFSLPAKLDYVSAPVLDPRAYRRVKVTNESTFLLLPGQAQLFDHDDYLGAAPVELTAPSQEIELFFGADDRIQVERELARREIDKKFMADRRRIRYGYEIKLKNHTGAPQALTLTDHIPVPRHENIKVRLEEAAPKPASHSELNVLEWELQLAEGVEQLVRYDFSVEFPQHMRVTGLP